MERTSVAIEATLGSHPNNWMLPALVLSLVCLMFLRTRLLAFILTTMIVTWLQMAVNSGTGGAAHHIILLWPFPCIFIGVALAGIADRVPARALYAVTTLAAVLVYRSEQIGDVAWGYFNNLRLLYGGNLKLTGVSRFIHKPVMTDDDRAQVSAMITAPDSIFIQHTDDQQIFDGVNEQLRSEARAPGYSEHIERIVHDNQARPVFEIFRFVMTP